MHNGTDSIRTDNVQRHDVKQNIQMVKNQSILPLGAAMARIGQGQTRTPAVKPCGAVVAKPGTSESS